MDEAQVKTALALLPASLFGSIINWSILYSILQLPSLKHAFGFLCANQALADALHSTSFLLFFCPMVLIDQPFMKFYSYHCGFFLYFCYEVSVCTHLVMSLNRCFATWTPYLYQRIFSDNMTKIVIVLVWIYTGTTSIFFFQILCQFYYDEQTQFLTFTGTEICRVISWYGVFLKNAVIVAIIMTMDIATVIKVRYSSNKIMKSGGDSLSTFSRREIRFLKQTVFQGGVFMLELSTYFFVPKYSDNRWAVFFATSFAWVVVHAADGIVVIIFNTEIRHYLFSRGKHVHSKTTANLSSIPSRNF